MNSSMSLPSIAEMYSFGQRNKDYNVVRKYEGVVRQSGGKAVATRRGHYLDDSIRTNSSPGPANQANKTVDWSSPNSRQCKHSERKTYIDDVQRVSVKKGMPAPCTYNVSPAWPKKQVQHRVVAERTNFMDTCQYESNRTPGPGAYPHPSDFKAVGEHKLPNDHCPRQPRNDSAADMTTYHPCPVHYTTFARLQQIGKSPKVYKNTQSNKINKENLPGPGAYRIINAWKGKTSIPKDQISYLNAICKGPIPSVYH